MYNQLIFLPNQTPVITAFADSDWGNNVDHRRSVSGYIIYLGTTPIVWKSKIRKVRKHSLAVKLNTGPWLPVAKIFVGLLNTSLNLVFLFLLPSISIVTMKLQ